ncbi:MAG: DUF5610 domain-containing protein [Motiliproteus sp.]|nr:DUF5610 domain-containing protein [Motiliproteus sp.]MCW9050842.1 DUF5610 domain-containing protein [Motiliproteus sp.]
MPVSAVGGSSAAPSAPTKESVPSQDTAKSSATGSKQSQNLAILEANRSVSLSAGNQPLSLVYQAAIDAINEELAPTMGENALERGQQQGLDVSPEATAERIVSMTTAMFDRYQDHRPELSATEQLDRFLSVIGGGIDQGFTEAREILDGLGVLEGEIAENIDRTYTLVQQGLEAFRQRVSESLEPDNPVAEA